MKKKEDKVKEETTQQQENKEKSIVNELNNKIKILEEEKNELINKVKLAQAELINYRVRKDEETSSILKYCNEDLIKEIIPTIDNFERAIKLEREDASDDMKKYYEGVHLIYASLTETLNKFGVTEINRLGEIFNPNEEQVLLTDTVEEKEDEEVLEVLLKGYKLKDRVIRPASVKINQK